MSKVQHHHPRGLPSRLIRETGIPQSVVSSILNGVRRPTLEQAKLLEEAFIRIGGPPITRWQMLYGYKPGVPLNTHFADPGAGYRVRPVEKRPRGKGAKKL